MTKEFDEVPFAKDYKTLYQLQDQTNLKLEDLFSTLHHLEARSTLSKVVKRKPQFSHSLRLLIALFSSLLCNGVLVISITPELQIERLMKRNDFTKKEAIARINNQMPLSEKEKRATYVVANTGTIDDLEKKLSDLLQEIGST